MNRKQRKAAQMAAMPQPTRPAPPMPATKPSFKITDDGLAALQALPKTKKRATLADAEKLVRPYEPMAGVLPNGKTGAKIAMDGSFNTSGAASIALGENMNGLFEQGYAFPGFTVLANWAQITEFRKPVEIVAREMTRKWIKLQATGEDDKADKIKLIDAEFKRLNVQAKFREAIEQDGFFGRSQIFIDVGMESDQLDTDELKTDLVEAPEKIGIGALKRLTVIEPIWSYPNRYNASDPLDPTFYKPTSWYVMGKEIHSSRLCTIVTREVPDILKPAYAFAGLSLSQMMKPYVDNWLRTRQSVSDLIHSFTVWVLKTNLGSILDAGAAQNLFKRVQSFNLFRDNHGTNVVDKETEDFANVSAPTAGLDKLQAQSQEQMCAPGGIPLVYLTGITPAGLNSSNKDEIEIFQDKANSDQEILTPHLSKILNIVQLSLFGEIDPEIGFIWEPLKVVTAKEKAEIRKIEAETDALDIELGSLDAEERRKRIADEEDSPYSGIDLNKEITPPDQGEGGDIDVKSLIGEHGDT